MAEVGVAESEKRCLCNPCKCDCEDQFQKFIEGLCICAGTCVVKLTSHQIKRKQRFAPLFAN